MREKPTVQRRLTRRRIDEPVFIAANAALEKKAEGLVVLDLRDLVSFADYFLICSGTSKKQVQAIADSITDHMKLAGQRPLHVEGYTRADWILLDYGGVVIHVFGREARDFYDLERLWRDAKPVTVRKAEGGNKKTVRSERKARKL